MAYVYKITNKITGEFYYGYRYRNQKLNLKPIDDLWIKYFTSSARIKKDIVKYGVDAFIPSIVYEHFDSVECWKKEQNLIKECWNDSLLLNEKYHDPDSNVEIYRRNNFFSQKTKDKMSAAGKGRTKSLEHRKKIALANTGKISSEQKRRKLSIAHRGKQPANKGISPPKFTCPHCGKESSWANLQKWHNDKCKLIDPGGHEERIHGISNLYKVRQ